MLSEDSLPTLPLGLESLNTFTKTLECIMLYLLELQLEYCTIRKVREFFTLLAGPILFMKIPRCPVVSLKVEVMETVLEVVAVVLAGLLFATHEGVLEDTAAVARCTGALVLVTVAVVAVTK